MAQPLSMIARKPARSTIRIRDAEDQKCFFFFFNYDEFSVKTFDQPCTMYIIIIIIYIYNKTFMNN